ncbi:MAG: 16S rRNA (guanine(527)-N(7))-methyltransferase RsmG [Candidatus Limnocylindrales bacterium]
MNREREPLPTHVRDTAHLPPEYDVALVAGLTGLGVTLPAHARAAIDGHIRLLLAWNTAINLTAIRDPATAATAHVIDSLSALAVLHARNIERFVDLGSGGGLPGVPLAVALPATDVLIAEPIGKKARFLTTAVAAIGLAARVRVATERGEALAGDARHRGRWSAVTARAVASTSDLVELAFPLLERGGFLVAWKRGELADELHAAGRAVDALGGGTIEVLDVARGALPALAGHCLVVATRTGRVPDGYPRDPAIRKRRPW